MMSSADVFIWEEENVLSCRWLVLRCRHFISRVFQRIANKAAETLQRFLTKKFYYYGKNFVALFETNLLDGFTAFNFTPLVDSMSIGLKCYRNIILLS